MFQQNEILEFIQKRRQVKAMLERVSDLWCCLEIRPYRKASSLRPSRQMVANWKSARLWFERHAVLMTYIGWKPHHFFRAGTEPYTCHGWGPAWMFCWSQPGLKVKPDRDGRIFFTWPTEKGCATTCWWPLARIAS